VATAGFIGELGKEAHEKRQKAEAEKTEAKRAERERKADEIESAIKNIQSRGALQPGQPGYLAPDDLKKELAGAQQQLSGLYEPHEGPALMDRLKKVFQKLPGVPKPAGGPVLKPGMTLDDVLAAGSPAPAQPKPGKVIGNPFPETDKQTGEQKWSVMEEDENGGFSKKMLPGYTQETRKQELVRAGYTEEEASKIMRIEGKLDSPAAPTRKGYKYDPATDEVVNQDTGERFTRDDVSSGIGGETVARMFEGQKKVDTQKKADKKAEQKTKFEQSLERQTHGFELAVARGDHAAANRYLASTKNDLVQARGRAETMDTNEKEALAGNQQAMLSLVANHIGMTLGGQKGARITRAVWDEAIESAPWLDQKISKWFHTDENGDKIFDGYKGGVTLTKDQIEQMVGLAHEKVTTLDHQVSNMQTEFQSELGGKTPAAKPSAAPPAAAPTQLTPEEQDIINKLKTGPS
jgi:hypothetical protein